MVTNPPPTSRRRSSLLPFRPQTSQGLSSYPQHPAPPRTSHSHVPPLPRSPSLDALRRLEQVISTIDSKRSFEPDISSSSSSRWSTHFTRHGYAIDTPEEGLSVHITQPEAAGGQQASLDYTQQSYRPIQPRPQHSHEHVRHQPRQYLSGHSRGQSTSTTAATSHSHSFLSQAKSLVRRASTTLGGQPSQKYRRGGNGNTSSSINLQIPEESVGPSYAFARPSTACPELLAEQSASQKSSGAKKPSLLKRMRSFRTRRDAISSAPGQSHPESICTYPHPSPPNHLHNQPVHQFDWPRPGAAARASAAAAATTTTTTSSFTMPFAAQQPAAGGRPPLLTRKDTKCSRSTKSSTMEYVEATKRADTAVEVDSVMEPAEKRLDPFTWLPPELTAQVLTHLDFHTLSQATRVSRAWHRQLHPTNIQLWRTIFLRRYKPRHTMTPTPLQMGGAGVGAPGRQPRDWYRMCRTRADIDQNWRRGAAAAVYFQGHTDSVYCAQFDETKIITGSRDRTIRVWDLETRQCTRVIGGPNARPAPPPPGEAPLECHHNVIHRGRNLNGTSEGDRLFFQPKFYHEASVLCLQFDSEILVTGSSDSSCIVWDIKTWQPIRRLEHHSAGVLDVCFDNRLIISCSKDNRICVWRRSDGELLRVLEGHRGPVNAVQMRGDLLVSASGDGMSKLWCLKKFVCIKDYQSRDRGLAAVEFSDDGKYILAGGNDQVIYKYDAQTAELVHTYAGHQGLVRSLFLDSQNNRVVSGSYDQAMRVYDFATGSSLGGDPAPSSPAQSPLTPPSNNGSAAAAEAGQQTGAYENWTTSWILSAKSDYRRIVATSQDGRALLMDFGHGIDELGLRLLKGAQ